ncbi:hypothetical protein CDAR_399421 [Caerostris darwini]|uniref:Uncharacterized protein n=1 Tax=Caerostris darwini TaxID=1538125 RepID=A0AAV4T3W1_9ARAC|nr:hypothetical protein CDAR_399421 [Caerostris darwini]
MVISRSPEISDRKSSQEGNEHFLAIYSDFPPFRAVIHILPILLFLFICSIPSIPAKALCRPGGQRGFSLGDGCPRARNHFLNGRKGGICQEKDNVNSDRGGKRLKISTDHATDGHACIQRLDE